ncbi:MAG: ROK family protein [Bdellovibrio sp.]|jgi:glucokinase
MTKNTFTIGLDLGGTKLAAGLINQKGHILLFQKESILELKRDVKNGPEKIVHRMGELVTSFQRCAPEAFNRGVFKGVGLASAGPLNVEKGILINPANFHGWKVVPIRDLLARELKKRRIGGPLVFQNDAIAAARAEGWIGRAKGLESYAVVTIGTGIGSGVIFRGRPVQTKGMGSEFGHSIVENNRLRDPKQLNNFTVEGLASGTGLLRRARNEMNFKGDSIEELVTALDAGQTKYQVLFDDAADTLAALCYNLSIGFHLEKILFSGGLIHVRRLYFERLKKRYKGLVTEFNPSFQCPLAVAKCLNKAGVVGAGALPYLDQFDLRT